MEEGDIQRKDTPLIPERVLREAIVNALMHRNYRTASPVQILRYSDRIEVFNVGYSLKPIEKLEETGSFPRNPHLASVLLDTRFAENKGSGIRTMEKMMKEAGLTSPIFISDRGADTFRAIYYFQHFLDAGNLKWLTQFSNFHLTSEESRALIYVKENGQINNSIYRELNKVDTNQASGILQKLCRKKILTRKGSGKQTFYILCSSRRERTLDGVTEENSNLPDKGLSIPDKALSIPDTLKDRINALGKRTSTEILEEIILSLCALKPMSAADLADILDKNVKYLMDHYLTPAIKSGKLVFRFPDKIRHPKQAYMVPQNLSHFKKD